MFDTYEDVKKLVNANESLAKKIKNWTDHPVWERIYFSLIWVLLIPLYIVHWIHNKL